jgi:hypothetical protein
MNRFMAILGLAVIALFIPMTGQAQVSWFSRSHFKIDKLSTRQDSVSIWVDGEITNNAKKEARVVSIVVRWFDKNGNVLDAYNTTVTDLAPGETRPFRAWTSKNPEIVRSNISIDSVIDNKGWLKWCCI